MTMPSRLAFERDGRDWPNRAASRFVRAGGFTWHVQSMGRGPAVLLLHGTGAATHSWRDLAPLLAARLAVIAPDLPGHSFTETPPARLLSLPGMSASLAALLRVLDVAPALVVGHSAGAAIAARMCLDGMIAPRGLISFNGALLPPYGLPGQVFSPLAKLLVCLPLLPNLFAWRANDPQVVARLLHATGSRLTPAGVALYARLVRNPRHTGAVLAMMAHWDLHPLLRDLPRLAPALLLVTGSNDRSIAPAEAEQVRALLPAAQRVSMPGLGHLAHEEQPGAAARLVLRFAADLGVLAA